MLSIATASYLAYRREVDYKGLNEAVTSRSTTNPECRVHPRVAKV
jgi:hypothetical protein